MRILKARELRRKEKAAETFRRADTHVAGQRVARVGNLLGAGLYRGLDRIDETEQMLSFRRKDEAATARFIEEQRAECVFQHANAPRDRRVIHAQPLGGVARALRAGDFEEIAQVVPVEFA